MRRRSIEAIVRRSIDGEYGTKVRVKRLGLIAVTGSVTHRSSLQQLVYRVDTKCGAT
jgi:lysophospholipid acyltransferase (LPLAT)-like uncharacterized protein